MKKTSIFLLSSILFSASALASEETINKEAMQTTAGGFQGPSVDDTLSTVEEVMNAGWLTDGNKVTLVGHIVKSMGNDIYTFQDSTGQMPIEIEADEWGGQTVTPKDKVKIFGEIEKNDSEAAVEADSVRIIK
ncbi:YgiW/YdeI family stress tolerance OB fold protein [Vibrio methylphosphonaticus]|uniref:YgiW/YdeI family stress tolerance OB fold protein n=1 Tax=Vibrio methylphosphonaticus TaxID=2946866 RepID=UPI00202ABBF0|nr:NirD/YgiW/YdeI family stress tolerance protein [Vibrio methylphosphonaticus]MCL9773117.1 NirD/YgiW/YdeI family stress tolerance protein [Vibrio methylphosphonaticus]